LPDESLTLVVVFVRLERLTDTVRELTDVDWPPEPQPPSGYKDGEPDKDWWLKKFQEVNNKSKELKQYLEDLDNKIHSSLELELEKIRLLKRKRELKQDF